MKKIKIGIDIDEILRAKWLKFDKCYVQEFGEESIPQDIPYVYDFFKEYPWEDTEEEIKMLNEDLPEDINPLEYQIDPETGEAPVDFLAFKKEKKKVTAKEKYNRFMFEDYLFEIFGAASPMYKNMDVDVEKFYKKYSKVADFVILSKENWLSIPPTLFFLSKIMSRFKEYRFVENNDEMWEGVDVLITTDPEILDAGTPEGKHIIKLQRPYNQKCQNGSIKKETLQINDLNENIEFEKIIGFPQDKDDSDVDIKKEENE